MSIQKAKIDGQIYDVISIDEYNRSPEIYGKFTAIHGEDGYVYPIRTPTDNRPGFCDFGGVTLFRKPHLSDAITYSTTNIINFSEATTIREVIAAQHQYADVERAILTTIDNEFIPDITARDTPEMVALKTAISDKHIDLDKYEKRFGTNYNNDRRLLNKNSVTFGKLKAIMDALDMAGTLIIEDKSPDVPNPIGRKIVVSLNTDTVSDAIEAND